MLNNVIKNEQNSEVKENMGPLSGIFRVIQRHYKQY